MENFITLISEARINLWGMQGDGLGAVLLTIIAVATVLSPSIRLPDVAGYIRAWRGCGPKS